jgi:hypothetical protein
MAVSIEEMIAGWRRREAERRERAEARAKEMRAKLPEARRLLESHGARKVILFGSLARGDVTERSDVDLAVEGVRALEYFTALAELVGLFDSPVDLVELETAGDSIKARVAHEGIPL